MSTHDALLDINRRWLRQAQDLLGSADKRKFSVWSGHLRHIVEFYDCFLNGLESTHVDYDARKRDKAVEHSPSVAATRIRSILDRLEKEPALRYDNVLFVRMEDADGLCLEDPYLMSSVRRELMTLSSHTVHHFALISMALRAHGVAVDPNLGVAPSTLRYRERTSVAEAA